MTGNLKHESRRRVCALVLLLVIPMAVSSPSALAVKRSALPTVENLQGRWIGLDCGHRVWMLHLQDDGSGAVAFSMSGGARGGDLAIDSIRDYRITLSVSGISQGPTRMEGSGTPKRLSLQPDKADCEVVFFREEAFRARVERAARALSSRASIGETPTGEWSQSK